MDSNSTGDYHVTFISKHSKIMIFVMTKLVGGLCGTNIKMIRMMNLSMVLVCCLDQSANQILINLSFG